MEFTRAQVNAAKAALGLDPDETQSVGIYPDAVFVSSIARDLDGTIPVLNGTVPYRQDTHQIVEEGTDDDTDA